ncbi:MAG: LysR family transcriptional regulator [Thermovirga sp.]
MITLFQLHSFCCVVEEGSFRSAAERLFVSQPSVSQHVASLEAHFGVSLFNRQKRRVRLTPEGRLLYATSREILDRIKDLGNRITTLQSLESGTLVIGCSPYTGRNTLPPVLERFAACFPAVNISLVIGDMNALETKLKRNDLELLIFEKNLDGMTDPEIICHPTGYEELVFVASRNMSIPKEPISASALEEIPMITYSGDNALDTYLDDFAVRNQIRFTRHIDVDSVDIAGKLAARGLGAAFLTRSTVESSIFEADLRILEITADPPARLEILAMYHRTQGLTYAGWEMLKLLERPLQQ